MLYNEMHDTVYHTHKTVCLEIVTEAVKDSKAYTILSPIADLPQSVTAHAIIFARRETHGSLTDIAVNRTARILYAISPREVAF